MALGTLLVVTFYPGLLGFFAGDLGFGFYGAVHYLVGNGRTCIYESALGLFSGLFDVSFHFAGCFFEEGLTAFLFGSHNLVDFA